MNDYQGGVHIGGIAVGEYGDAPVATGAGVKTFTYPVLMYEAWEDTVIASFADADGDAVVTEWETVTIDTSLGTKLICFHTPIKSMTVTSGGKGKVYYANR